MTARLTQIFGSRKERNPHSLYETPNSVIDELFDFANLPQGEEYHFDLLEPHAGTGRIAAKLQSRLPNSNLHVCEIDETSQDELVENGYTLIGKDFLNDALPQQYDFIVANPPFSGTSYIEHVRRIFDALKPGGVAGIILPESFLWRSEKKSRTFRNWLATYSYWEPIGSPFTYTNIKCLQVKLHRNSDEFVKELWAPSNGYESHFQEEIEIAIGSEREWDAALSQAAKLPVERRKEFLESHLDTIVERLIQKEYCCFLYSERVKEQLIRSALEDVLEY